MVAVAVVSTVEDRVGTANIKVTLSDTAAEQALRTVLRQGAPELLAIQEWDGPNPGLGGHWRFNRPHDPPGPTGPVVFNASRYTLISCRAHVLVGAGFVGRLPGRKSTLPPSVATVATFTDDVLGGETVLINAHLTAEVQDRHGNYHPDAAHRRRVRRHKAERRAVIRLVRRKRRRGRRVYSCADTNFDGMTLPPLISCWERRSGGTLGSRAVDIIFGPERAHAVQTIATASDHDAVVAVYKREK